jgi:hypothetical protein
MRPTLAPDTEQGLPSLTSENLHIFTRPHLEQAGQRAHQGENSPISHDEWRHCAADGASGM